MRQLKLPTISTQLPHLHASTMISPLILCFILQVLLHIINTVGKQTINDTVKPTQPLPLVNSHTQNPLTTVT